MKKIVILFLLLLVSGCNIIHWPKEGSAKMQSHTPSQAILSLPHI